MRPIIKWTGGKYDEFKEFSSLIPNFKEYFEPFFGSGGVFFALEPKEGAYVNDKSTDLVEFYEMVGNAKFKAELEFCNERWLETKTFASEIFEEMLKIYKEFKSGSLDNQEASNLIESLVEKTSSDAKFLKLFSKKSWPITGLEKFISKSILDKTKRIIRIETKGEKTFTSEEMSEHFETAVKSGFYFQIRKITNMDRKGMLEGVDREKIVACWYFVRDTCYGSMFRFNANGEFNIPYGGIAYNKKNFSEKIERMFSEKYISLFSSTNLYKLDFENFINQSKPSKGDFMFIDPPYDSTFSEYDNNAFGKSDHERLAKKIEKAKYKWMMVIKNTKFIHNLYDKTGFYISSFDKTYRYSARGRNNQKTEHLIITNYDTNTIGNNSSRKDSSSKDSGAEQNASRNKLKTEAGKV